MLQLTHLHKSFQESNGSTRQIFDDADFHLLPHEKSLAIVGRSGAGKSTLLRILSGLDQQFEGLYSFKGAPLAQNESEMAAFRRNHVGIVTQRYELLPHRSLLNNVMLGAVSPETTREDAEHYLDLVGLADIRRKKVRELSGGEAQRVAIARALVKNPDFVFADEPTGALDEATEESVLGIFQRLQEQGVRFVIATHSSTVKSVCERVVRVHNHKLVDETGRYL